MVSHRLCAGYADQPALRAQYSLTVIGEEPSPAYDRTRLSECVQDGAPAPRLASADWYAKAGIDLRLGTPVVAIAPAHRQVTLADGQVLPYDRLVLATGAAAAIPPIEGADLPGLFVYRTEADVQAIAAAAVADREGVVVGGGLLGLEAARVLADLGMRVTVVENAKALMSRQLDADSGLLLDERVRDCGIRTLLGHRLARIEGADREPSTAEPAGLRLTFEDGQSARASLIVLATGIRPRDELAAAAGLRLGSRGGVIVDDHLRSSDPSIYAVGECAVHRGKHYGLVLPGYEMADALLKHLAGRRGSFRAGDTSCQLKLLGVPVAAVGLSDQEGRRESYQDGAGRRTLVLDGRRLLGATSVGPWKQLARVQDAARRELRVSQRQLRRFAERGDLWAASEDHGVADWPAATVVCNCTGVSRGALSACAAGGVLNVAALTRRTGAGSLCGGCLPLLGELCGSRVSADTSGRRPVLLASLAALLLGPLLMALGPVPVGDSVRSSYHLAAELWRDPLGKQLTGYTLVGLAAIGMLMSARKRLDWFKLGDYGAYRSLHAVLSLLALLVACVHTGLRMGHNANFALMACFLAVAVVGSVAGVATALESGSPSVWAQRARRLRPALSLAHVLLLWPIPLLLGLHVFSVYYF